MLRLIIITTICVFVSAISLIPELWKWIQFHRINSTAQNMLNLCISARSEAIRTVKPVSVIVKKDHASVKHEFNKTIVSPSGIFFAPEGIVTFNRSGIPEHPLDITITDGRELYITSGADGVPQIERSIYEE